MTVEFLKYCVSPFFWHFLITSIFRSLYFLKWCPVFDSSPLHQFSKLDYFLCACWFLGKNLSNFVSLSWRLDNPYYHTTHGAVQMGKKIGKDFWKLLDRKEFWPVNISPIDIVPRRWCRSSLILRNRQKSEIYFFVHFLEWDKFTYSDLLTVVIRLNYETWRS